MTDSAPEGRFALADEGARWVFAGNLTFENAEGAIEASRALPWPTRGVVDLSGLAHADSAALAVMLALRRRASTDGGELAFVSVPATIVSLARVYGVDALVGV